MTPFSRERLEELYSKLDIPFDTRLAIDRAFHAPVRRVQTTTANSPSRLPCPKMGIAVQSESRTVERKAIHHYLFAFDVIGYLDQPLKTELSYLSKSGKRVRHTYTPDFIVFYLDSIYLEEWKDAKDVEKLIEKNPGRYMLDENGCIISPPAQDAANQLGLKFRIRADSELSDIAYRNHGFLRSYLLSRSSISVDGRSALRDFFAHQSYASIGELRDAVPTLAIDDIHYAIANSLISVDFDSAFVREESRFLVFRDDTVRDAYIDSLSHISSFQKARTWSRDLFLPGAHVVFGGKNHSVILNGDHELWLQPEQGDPFSLRHSVVEKEFKKERLQVISTAPEEDPLYLGSPLKNANPNEVSRAIAIRKLFRNWQKGGPRPAGDYSDRTYREYARKEREAIARGDDPIVAFLPKWSARGNRGSKLVSRVDEIIDEVLDEHFDNLIGRTKWSVFGTLTGRLEKEKFAAITKRTFLHRVKKHVTNESIRRRKGRKSAYQKRGFVWFLDIKSPPHGDYPFHIIHIDHTELEIEVISSLTGENLGRPWLTLAMCAFTRRVVGFFLSLKRPRYFCCMAVMFDIVRRYGRIPDIIVADGGSEFGATDYEKLCAFLEIEPLARPKSAARAGCVLERLLGYVQSAFIHNLIGNTKLRRNVRELTPENNPSTLAVYTLAELYEGLDEWFFELYDTRRHTALLISPRAAFEQGLINSGQRLQRLRNAGDLIPMAFPSVRGQTRKFDVQRGVIVNYQKYSNPRIDLMSEDKTDVHVKPHLLFPDIVYVLFKGEWVPFYSKLHKQLEHMVDYAKQGLFEEWIVHQQIVEGDQLTYVTNTSEMVDRRNSDSTRRVSGPIDEIDNQLANDQNSDSDSENDSNTDDKNGDRDDVFSRLIQKIKLRGSYDNELPK